MRIIQTLYLQGNDCDPFHESLGFLSPEFNWMSWALSCLQLKQYYPNVHLYTNSRGYEVLITKLKLPYDTVFMLDDLEFPPQLWAYPKLHVYSLQSEPFLHVDGDAFFWEPLDNDLLNKPLIAQNLEINEPWYQMIIRQMIANGLVLPETISKHLGSGMPLAAYNAGIIGGNDLAFFKEYTSEAFDFLKRNELKLKEVCQPQFNMVLEQVLLYCLAVKRQREAHCYIKQPLSDMTYPGFANFANVPYQTRFIHLMGSFKTNAECCYMLAKRLRQNYPEYYYRVIEECKKAGVKLFLNCYNDSPDPTPPNTVNIDWQKVYNQEKEQAEKIERAFTNEEGLVKARFKTNRLLRPVVGEKEKGFNYAPDGYSRQFKKVEGDELDQLLISALERRKTFDALLHHISKYFDREDTSDRASFAKLISMRLKNGCFNNVFEIV